MAKKIISLFLKGTILLLIAGNLFAYDLDKIHGFDEKVFNYYFDRADRELDPQSWMRQAKDGISLAIAAWEKQTFDMFSDPDLRLDAVKMIKSWSEEELERRYTEWLFNRFFGAESAYLHKALDEAITEANQLYATPSGQDTENAHDLWNQMVNSVAENELNHYEFKINHYFPELFFYDDPDGQARMEELLGQSFTRNVINHKEVLEALMAKEERLFTVRQSGQSRYYQQNRQKDNALSITADLIREAQYICDAGIAALEEKIEAAFAGTGDLAVYGNDWLLEFQEQFERGLKAWTDAEERFLIRRMEWEANSIEQYNEGKETWINAFNELKRHRENWENQVEALFNQGEQLFINASEKLDEAINNARAEFENDMSIRLQNANEKTDSLLSIYFACIDVVQESKKSISFWVSFLNEYVINFNNNITELNGIILSEALESIPTMETELNYDNALENKTLINWVNGILAANQLLIDSKSDLSLISSLQLSEYQTIAALEIIRWAGLYYQYQAKASDIIAELESDFNLLLGMDFNSLASVLNNDSETYYLDEYQIELLRVKGIVDYWNNRLIMAEAVLSYTDELFFGRITEEESYQNWQNAKALYENALLAYEAAQIELNNAGSNVSAINNELSAIIQNINAVEKELKEAYDYYSSLLIPINTVDIGNMYQELYSQYNILTDLITNRINDPDFYLAFNTINLEYNYVYDLLLDNDFDFATQKENAAIQLASFQSFFEKYNVTDYNTYLPDISILYENLIKYSSINSISLTEVVSDLLFDLYSNMVGLPDYIIENISVWTDALINYTSIKACLADIDIYSGINETFIDELFEKYTNCLLLLDMDEDNSYEDYFNIILNESNLIDLAHLSNLFNFIEKYDNYIIELEKRRSSDIQHWKLFFSTRVYLEDLLKTDLAHYLIDANNRILTAFDLYFNYEPELSYEDLDDKYFDNLKQTYTEENTKLLAYRYDESALIEYIENLTRTYNDYQAMNNCGPEYVLSKSTELQDELNALYDQLIGDYNTALIKYVNAGNTYENLYGEVKRLFNELQNARIEYEIQDSIQRYSNSQYLFTVNYEPINLEYYKDPVSEYNYAKEHYERAYEALVSLTNLYNNNETSRPFNDTNYNAILELYKESFDTMHLSYKAMSELGISLQEERLINYELFNTIMYNSIGSVFVNLSDYYSNYSTKKPDEQTWLDFIYINDNGTLSINYDKDSFNLQSISITDAKNLTDYFSRNGFTGYGNNDLSSFQIELSLWAQRIATYDLNNTDAFYTFALALDYLISNLVGNNPDIKKILESYSIPDLGADGYIKINNDSINYRIERYYKRNLPDLQINAWNSLTEEQKTDIEFLAALVLLEGGNDWASYFFNVAKYRALQEVKKEADSYVYTQKILGKNVTFYKYPYIIDHSELSTARKIINNHLNNVSNYIESDKNTFLSSLQNYIVQTIAYSESLERLSSLMANNADAVEWSDIEQSLSELSSFSEQELEALSNQWNNMVNSYLNNNKELLCYNVLSALNALYVFNEQERDDLLEELEKAYESNRETREEHHIDYMELFDSYIKGECSLEALNAAAVLAFGDDTASIKKHLNNMGTILIDDLSKFYSDNPAYSELYLQIRDELKRIINTAYNYKYVMELNVRINEWEEQKKDLYIKQQTWLQAYELIIERGQLDWDKGYDSMLASFNKWNKDFWEQYNAIDEAWNAAYLESLNKKELWINQAMSAADQAHNENLLAILGSDAESAGRALDTFIPSSIMYTNTLEQTAAIMHSILNSAGITGMTQALNSLQGSAATALTSTKIGLSGQGLWDSGQAVAFAKEFVRTTTTDLANAKMETLAYKAREDAYNAKKSIEQSIASTNKKFDSDIDNVYLLYGGWNRSGQTYNKDIIVNSTVFTSAITEKKTVDSYYYFILDHWDFSVDLSDAYLATLDYKDIQYLIYVIEIEIRNKREALFGGNYHNGELPQWIGNFTEHNSPRNSGELGRLLDTFSDFEKLQENGIAFMDTPLYNKALWDSSGTWFTAPSLRGAIDIVNGVAAAVGQAILTAYVGPEGAAAIALGINMTDDLLFDILDIANGYSTSDVVLRHFKKAGITAATNYISMGVGSVASNLTTQIGANTIGGVLVNTGIAVGQSIATNTVSSAINAITFNWSNGLGWDNDVFYDGFKSGLISSVATGAGTFVTGMMNMANMGENVSKLAGFSQQNIGDVQSFNNLIGGLAQQGVNYILTGNANFNILNLSMLGLTTPDGTLIQHGLLELTLGKNGPAMALGSGGTDISFNAWASSFRAIEVLGVNYLVNDLVKKEGINIPVALRSLYGFGDEIQKDKLYDILNRDTALEVLDNNSKLSANYDTENGVISISGYHSDMDLYEQLRLGSILGLEAYKDVYNFYDFNDFRNASIAKNNMNKRIGKDYNDFFIENIDFSFEILLGMVDESLISDGYELYLYDFYLKTNNNNLYSFWQNDYFYDEIIMGRHNILSDNISEYFQSKYDTFHALSDIKKIETAEDFLLNNFEYLYDRNVAINEIKYLKPAEGRLTSGYKIRKNPFNEDEFQTHASIDIGIPQRTELLSSASGTIEATGYSQTYGNYVVLNPYSPFLNPDGNIRIIYSHLNQIDVESGDWIVASAVFGLSGGQRGTNGAGSSTGPHLDLMVRKDGINTPSWGNMDNTLNPLFYFSY